MDLFTVSNKWKYQNRLYEMRRKADKRLRRIKAIDRDFNLVSIDNKYDYLKGKHPKYLEHIDRYLTECGSITIKHGDSSILDYTKTHLYGSIFL